MKLDFEKYVEDVVLGHDLIRIDDYIGTNLLYQFTFNGIYYHAHNFNSLLKQIAWVFCDNDSNEYNFSFEEFKKEYSEQEYDLIKRFIMFLMISKENIEKNRVTIQL